MGTITVSTKVLLIPGAGFPHASADCRTLQVSGFCRKIWAGDEAETIHPHRMD